jgi:ferrochelatase
MTKKGILLINLGTPDDPSRGAVYRYLKEFLLDPRVIDIPAIQRNLLVRGVIAPFRSKPSSELYQQLWTDEGSPLKFYGERLRDLLQKEMGDEYLVELAMRYQSPSIESVLKKMLLQNVSELVIVPLFPHYASASTGSVYEEVMRLLSKEQAIPKLRFVNAFYDHPDFIAAFVERARVHDVDSFDHVLFSYHGMPIRQLVKADHSNHCTKAKDCCLNISEKNQHCYSAQCYATTKALVKELNLKEGQYTTCFQSRLGKDPWVQPYTSDTLKKRAAAGDKSLLVFCPAFIAVCLETTIEVSVEYQHEFQKMGGEKVQLVESLNDHPTWVKALHKIIMEV